MKVAKRGHAMVIIGLGILGGEGHNWECINVKSAISRFVRLIPPKSIGFAGVVKELAKRASK